jgi:putative ABC transport system ATP-binding protein
MLSISGLVKRYGPRTVLAELDLIVEPGTVVAIVGESGSGKSTLLNIIGGLEKADAGRVMLAGTDMGGLDDDARTRLRCHSIGFVFQAFHIIPHLTALENTMLPLVLQGVGARERRERASAQLAAVGLGGRAGALPGELSGGELQRVAIARALVHEPALILADEPTGNLDPDTAHAVLGLLNHGARARRAATILVTHSEAAAATADRVLRLARGTLHDGPSGRGGAALPAGAGGGASVQAPRAPAAGSRGS